MSIKEIIVEELKKIIKEESENIIKRRFFVNTDEELYQIGCEEIFIDKLEDFIERI